MSNGELERRETMERQEGGSRKNEFDGEYDGTWDRQMKHLS